DPVLTRIGERHGKSASQVALRWLAQQSIIPIPRTSNPDKLAANLAIFDFALSEPEMAEIAALKRPDGRVVNPPHAPKWDAYPPPSARVKAYPSLRGARRATTQSRGHSLRPWIASSRDRRSADPRAPRDDGEPLGRRAASLYPFCNQEAW